MHTCKEERRHLDNRYDDEERADEWILAGDIPTHLCVGRHYTLPPALGVVEDLWRQLVDPPLQSGD